ncbi:MAG: sulfotransferase [Actinobacteria bacterium]|nr:sulfotransferase [Actinomycetota bacterium]
MQTSDTVRALPTQAELADARAGVAPVLVTGVPRSSTTWTAALLAAACGEPGLVEPDNHHHQPLTMVAKRGLGSFPVLRPGDIAPAFADHWRRVIAGAWPRNLDPASVAADRLLSGLDRRARDLALLSPEEHGELFHSLEELLAGFSPPRDGEHHLVIKSVQLSLALEWFAELMPEVRIVVVERDPLDVTASWTTQYGDDMGPLAPGWRERLAPDGDPPSSPRPDASPVERIAWKVGLLHTAHHKAATRLNCHVIEHEPMCEDPEPLITSLARDLSLPYPEAAAAKARQTNSPGSGYQINRLRAGLAGSARRRLSHAQRTAAERVLDGFGIPTTFAPSPR